MGIMPPSVVVSVLVAAFSVQGNYGFPTLLHNRRLGWVALTQFQPNPKTTTTITIDVYTPLVNICTPFLLWAYPILQNLK